MKRLTWHNGEYWTQVQDTGVGYKDICARLAAYEDTGLEPEDLNRVLNEGVIIKLVARFLGVAPELLRELAEGKAVPVVRCRECKHRGWVQEPCHGKTVNYCRRRDMVVRKDDFCSHGEKKDGGTE